MTLLGGRSAAPIAAAGMDEAPGLAALHALAFETPWDTAALSEMLASPLVFALSAGAPALGFVLARAVMDEAEILTLAVAPSARLRGVGRALVEAAASRAEAGGAQTLWLEVAEDNAAALALYGAAGFQTVGRRPAYYPRAKGAVDALSLQRRLNSAPA